MKENEFLDGVSNIESDVVERFISMDNKLQNKANKKPKRVWIRFGAIAACFLLIVSAVIVVPMLLRDDQGVVIPPDETSNSDIDSDVVTSLEDAKNNDDTSDAPGAVESTEDTSGNDDMWAVNISDHTPIIFDATESPDLLNGNSLEFIKGSSVSISGGANADAVPPKFEFSSGIAVKAKVFKNYPDKYYKLDVSSEYRPTAYRLIQMETIEVISGENVPQYFLYLIPEYVYVDMSVYDSLLISMSQIGFENYVLKNATQNRMESFELLMFADYQDNPELGNIIAFTDGIFDESLWQNETWLFGYQFARYYLDNPKAGNLVVFRGDSESTVISAIKARYPVDYREPYVITLNFNTQEAKDAIEYVKPFANGVFSQTYWPYNGNELVFRRYINGCQTEETIRIDLDTEEVTYSEVRYSKEDMEQIENISAHLSQKASEYAEQLPTPPHTDPEGKELLCLNLYAWYAKVDGKLYGVVKTAWRYQEADNYFHQYYDASYVLYDMSAGTAAEISRDSLVAIIGDRNVNMRKYGVGFEMPAI